MRRDPRATARMRGCFDFVAKQCKPFAGKKTLSQIAFYKGAEQAEKAQQFRVFGGGSAAAERLGKKSGEGIELGRTFVHTDMIFRARFS